MVSPVDVRLWRRPATLVDDVAASTHAHVHVDRLFLEIVDGAETGFGEVSPLARRVEPDPSIDEVIAHFSTVTLPRVISFCAREGRLPEWSRIHLWSGGPGVAAWSGALLEMALLDLTLVKSRVGLEDSWGVAAGRVGRMATTSLIEVDPHWSPPPDAVRVRVKIRGDLDPVRAMDVAAQWGRPVLLDFNGGAGDVDTALAWERAARDRVDLVAIEQPFGAGDLASHALLARDLRVALSLDESVTSTAVIRLIARHDAAQMVCVKPPRVGGLAVARHALGEAATHGLRTYVGGFFESPLARRAHAAVAAGASVEASDVAPVGARGDADDADRETGLGTVPALSEAILLSSWENQ